MTLKKLIAIVRSKLEKLIEKEGKPIRISYNFVNEILFGRKNIEAICGEEITLMPSQIRDYILKMATDYANPRLSIISADIQFIIGRFEDYINESKRVHTGEVLNAEKQKSQSKKP